MTISSAVQEAALEQLRTHELNEVCGVSRVTTRDPAAERTDLYLNKERRVEEKEAVTAVPAYKEIEKREKKERR